MQKLKIKTFAKTGTAATDREKLHPPIFILGSGRSGTSLIRSILQSNSDFYCIEGETHLFSTNSNPYLNYIENFQTANDLENITLSIISSILYGHEVTALFARDKKFPKDVAEIYNEIEEFFIDCKYKSNYELFDICITHITKKENKKRWVEKTPNNIFHIPEILSVYPDAKFIEIYRDPRAVYYSWKNASQDYFKKTGILECIAKWKKTFEYSKQYACELPNQFYKIKYENLIETPETELANLYKFLGEDFNYTLLKDLIDKSKAYAWKIYLTNNELLLIETKAKKYMKESGYIDFYAKKNLQNAISFILFYAKKLLEEKERFRLINKAFDRVILPVFKLVSRLIILTNKLLGRTVLLVNKNIKITNEIFQSIYKRNYSFKRNFKILYWTLKRKDKINEYLNSHNTKKLHIGAGKNMLSGWLNTNLTPLTKEDIFLDAGIRFPFEDNTFDYISSKYQIEHLTHGQSLVMLKQCLRVLKPGGKIKITTLDLESCVKDCFKINALFSKARHKFIYNKSTLVSNLEKCGFRDISFYKTEEDTFALEATKPLDNHNS